LEGITNPVLVRGLRRGQHADSDSPAPLWPESQVGRNRVWQCVWGGFHVKTRRQSMAPKKGRCHAIHDLESWEVVLAGYLGPTDRVNDFDVSPGGKWLALACGGLWWLLVSSARVWQVKSDFSADRPRSSRCNTADWQLVEARSSRWRMTYCSQIGLEGKLNCASNSSLLAIRYRANSLGGISSSWRYGCKSGEGRPAQVSIRFRPIGGDSSDRIEPGYAG
jgi:hypothetical protein